MQTFFFLQHAVKFFILAAAIAGFWVYPKLRGTSFRWFPVYLLVIACCELTGYLLKLYKLQGASHMYMFFVIPLEFLFFHWLYYCNLERRYRPLVITCTLAYLASFAAEKIWFTGSPTVFMSLSYTVGNLTLLVMAIIYFVRLMTSERIIHFYEDIFFWINLGSLLFYLGTLPYYGLFNYLALHYYGIFLILSWAGVLLNITMYLLFLAGFIWGKPKS